jgi:hypothetical protein
MEGEGEKLLVVHLSPSCTTHRFSQLHYGLGL